MSKNKVAGLFGRVIIAAFVVVGLAGCVKSGSGSQNSNNISFITLMNMAPYAPQTEVYFNNVKQTQPIAAGSYSSSYGQIPPGAYSIQFKKSGSDSVLSEVTASLYDSLGFYTVILYNTAGGNQIRSTKIADDFSDLQTSFANYRFFNLCPDATAVDLYLNNTKVSSNRSLADIAGNSIYSSFQSIAPGSFSAQVKLAGTDSVIASAANVNLSAANAYTLFLQGSVNNTTNPIALKVLMAQY